MTTPEIGRRLRSGKLRATLLADMFFDRISTVDKHTKSYARLMEESARREAARADRELAAGFDRGALHGIPVAVKDLVDSKGVVTAAGMAIHADRVPNEDATVLQRLRAAGAVVLGKLAMTEGALLEHHPSIPAPRNPWRSGHDSGFSSSGPGVAVAAGLCAAAVGSDTGGSIRIPAAFNGVTGLRPTWGRVSRHGVIPLIDFLDTIGPIARSAAGAAAMLRVIAGADEGDPTAEVTPVPDYPGAIELGLSGLRIGVDWRRVRHDCTPAVADGLDHVAATLAARGALLRDVSVPPIDLFATMPLFLAGVSVGHCATYPIRADEYGSGTRAVLDAGRATTGMDLARAINVAEAFKAQLRALFGDIDLLLVPAFATTAPPVGALIAEAKTDPGFTPRRMAYTLPFSFSGSPTITFPTGFANGLPIAAQIVGPHFSESLLLRAAHAFQTSTDWHLRRPTVAQATNQKS